jgi:murein L,D-transpeptidase YcbB/YkuD
MKTVSRFRLFGVVLAVGCSILRGTLSLAAEPPADLPPVSEAESWIRGLKMTEKGRKDLLAELQELHPVPGQAIWPEGMRKALNSADGVGTVRKVLIKHGFLPSELRWLDELPRDAPADLLTSIVILQTRRLLREGPPAYEGLWPKWNIGDTPGSEPDEEKEPGALLPWIARHADEKVDSFLQSFAPRNVVYQELHASFVRLTDELETRRAEFIAIPPIKPDQVVKPGDAYEGAPILERRLIEEGYLLPAAPPPVSDPASPVPSVCGPVFTAEMSEAVRRYQFHQGRTVDGILGPDTLGELNRSPDQELEVLRINLHRARMLPDQLGNRYLLVNIPSTRVDVFSGSDKPLLSMKAIVGESVKTRQTPVFRDVMETVEFGPYWNVPVSIAKREIVPKARRDDPSFELGNYELVEKYTSSRALPVNGANLARAGEGRLLIRQRPGPKNALGRVKFLFPNDFHIYLHDTPEGRLFDEAERDFSHGCIRIEKPVDLAEFVLTPQGWTREQIEEVIASGLNRQVKVENPVNVYIIYLTAFPSWEPDEGGRRVRFHPDLYQHDPQLLKKLQESQQMGP